MIREENEHMRLYSPLLQRIIILMVVIAAVPVVLWGITNFVRSYVGRPKVPTFHALAKADQPPAVTGAGPGTANATIAAATVATPQSTTPQSTTSATPSPTVADDAPVSAAPVSAAPQSAAPRGPYLGDQASAGNAATPIAMTRATPADPATAATPADSETTGTTTPVPAGPNSGSATPPATAIGALAMQTPSSDNADQAADALPAADPLAGPVPLPLRRPKVFALAQLGVPLPRPRPGSIETASETPPGPLDWLQKLFHPQSQTPSSTQ